MNYYLDFLTRKVFFQALYENICNQQEDMFGYMRSCIKDPTHMLSEEQINAELFYDILNSLEDNWEYVNKEQWVEDTEKISICALSIIKSAFAELVQKDKPKNILINEYVKLAKMFCENEDKMVNKVLDNFAKFEHETIFGPSS